MIETLQVAIDVSGDGHLPWPPSSEPSSPSALENITLFLTSYTKSRNFTIIDADPVLRMEPSSTVKHVNWIWPECFVGDGDGDDSDSARGDYNISMHQTFRWNGTEYYTVFDLPVSVTNGIAESDERVDCDVFENEMVGYDVVAKSSDDLPGQPWVNGTGAETGGGRDSSSASRLLAQAGVRRLMIFTLVNVAGAVLLSGI